MEILIFRTDLRTKKQIKFVKPILNRHPAIHDWCIDKEDIDNVLRIETLGAVNTNDIIDLLKIYGVYCEDLDT